MATNTTAVMKISGSTIYTIDKKLAVAYMVLVICCSCHLAQGSGECA